MPVEIRIMEDIVILLVDAKEKSWVFICIKEIKEVVGMVNQDENIEPSVIKNVVIVV